jgi:hypothetical protein
MWGELFNLGDIFGGIQQNRLKRKKIKYIK